MKYLISPEKKQYKANLHCHSVLSDGKKTPEELKEMYKARGYSILAITDHERPREHQALSGKDYGSSNIHTTCLPLLPGCILLLTRSFYSLFIDLSKFMRS